MRAEYPCQDPQVPDATSGRALATRWTAQATRLIAYDTIGSSLLLRPRALARQPALSAAQPDRAVLGRQRHRRAHRGGAYCARHAVVPALERRVPDHSAVRLAPSGARLAADPEAARHDDPALRHRNRRLQHAAILGARTHPGAQHAVAAIGGTAVRRNLVAGPARRAADAGAGLRHRAVAMRRAGDPAARRPHHLEEY